MCSPHQVEVSHRHRRLSKEDICDHREMFQAVIHEETLDEKVQDLLDSTEDPALRENFGEIIEIFRDAPHERAGRADQSGKMEELLEFLKEYRKDSVSWKGGDLLRHVQTLMNCK